MEFEGQVLLVGNWGDQRTTPTNSLFQAVYDGTMEEFWASLFYPGALGQSLCGVCIRFVFYMPR